MLESMLQRYYWLESAKRTANLKSSWKFIRKQS